jgi:hypothetical protein
MEKSREWPWLSCGWKREGEWYRNVGGGQLDAAAALASVMPEVLPPAHFIQSFVGFDEGSTKQPNELGITLESSRRKGREG